MPKRITKEYAIEREERSMGGPIKPLRWMEIDGGAGVLTYESRISPEPNLGTLISLRFAVHIPYGGGSSGIIKSWWEKDE